ncbi:hypothetical protein [Streptomyces sp. YIM S03343]
MPSVLVSQAWPEPRRQGKCRQLATGVDHWWPEITAFIATGHSNAKGEAINRVIKLVPAQPTASATPPTSA